MDLSQSPGRSIAEEAETSINQGSGFGERRELGRDLDFADRRQTGRFTC